MDTQTEIGFSRHPAVVVIIGTVFDNFLSRSARISFYSVSFVIAGSDDRYRLHGVGFLERKVCHGVRLFERSSLMGVGFKTELLAAPMTLFVFSSRSSVIGRCLEGRPRLNRGAMRLSCFLVRPP